MNIFPSTIGNNRDTLKIEIDRARLILRIKRSFVSALIRTRLFSSSFLHRLFLPSSYFSIQWEKKAKGWNAGCKGEMEKQLRHQRSNSEFGSQSILRKPRTISNVDNSLAVPYLPPPSAGETFAGMIESISRGGRMENLQRKREVFAIPRRTVSDFLKLGERGSHRNSSSIPPPRF